MKNCLSLPGLGWKNFNSLRTEEDKPIYTYNDKYIRWFVRQTIKRGRVCAFNQYYKSKHCDNILIIINKEVAVKGSVYDTIEAYMEYRNKNILKSLRKNMKSISTNIDLKTKTKNKDISMKN